MCLNMITKRHATPTTEERRAYKVVEVASIEGIAEATTPYTYAPLEVGVWMTAYETTLRTEGRMAIPGVLDMHAQCTCDVEKKEFYTSGWHTFATRREARAFLKMTGRSSQRIVAVKVRGITTEGYDGSSFDYNFISAKFRTLVSKEMFIESLKRVR